MADLDFDMAVQEWYRADSEFAEYAIKNRDKFVIESNGMIWYKPGLKLKLIKNSILGMHFNEIATSDKKFSVWYNNIFSGFNICDASCWRIAPPFKKVKNGIPN